MRIVVFRYGQLGDALVALPAMRVLRRHFPTAEIVLLEPKPKDGSWVPCGEVFRHQGVIDRVRRYGGPQIGNRGVRGSLLALREERADVLVYLAPRLRGRLRVVRDLATFRLLGIKRVVGHRAFRLAELQRGRGNGVPRVESEVDHLISRLRASGLEGPGAGHADARFIVTEADRARLELKVPGLLGELRGRRAIAVAPGTKWPSKQWPIDRYARVVSVLAKRHGVFPVVFGGSEERELSRDLLRESSDGVSLAGETSIEESAAAMKECRLYLGNDTGAMHLAAAVGLPCVVPFSAQDWPGRWEPYGGGHQILRRNVECAGCQLYVCTTEKLRCLLGIEVEAVVQACEDVLARDERGGRLADAIREEIREPGLSPAASYARNLYE